MGLSASGTGIQWQLWPPVEYSCQATDMSFRGWGGSCLGLPGGLCGWRVQVAGWEEDPRWALFSQTWVSTSARKAWLSPRLATIPFLTFVSVLCIGPSFRLSSSQRVFVEAESQGYTVFCAWLFSLNIMCV